MQRRRTPPPPRPSKRAPRTDRTSKAIRTCKRAADAGRVDLPSEHPEQEGHAHREPEGPARRRDDAMTLDDGPVLFLFHRALTRWPTSSSRSSRFSVQNRRFESTERRVSDSRAVFDGNLRHSVAEPGRLDQEIDRQRWTVRIESSAPTSTTDSRACPSERRSFESVQQRGGARRRQRCNPVRSGIAWSPRRSRLALTTSQPPSSTSSATRGRPCAG